MRIALLSYEYPLDTPAGGIATYTRQAAHLLKSRGHDVEIFAGSPHRDADIIFEDFRVHLVRETDRCDFAVKVAYRLEAEHQRIPFDVVEGPELYSETRKVLQLLPNLPVVIRMHTPNLRIWQLSVGKRTITEVLSDLWGQLYSLPWYIKRGHRIPDFRFVRPEIAHAQHQDMIENDCALQADRVVALFPGMSKFLTDVWRIPPDRVVVLPNPFTPDKSMLEIPCGTCTDTISFIGRLEVRKGILDWMRAIPEIASQFPNARFRFVGASSTLSDGTDSLQYLKTYLKPYENRLEFRGPVSPSRIHEEFASTGIVVAPSIWENYPYACLEAMASGRAVIGSSAGGMAVMLANGAGRLVSPKNPRKLAAAVCELLHSPEQQKALGEKAREKVLSQHDPDTIGKRMEQLYETAILHRQSLGPRPS